MSGVSEEERIRRQQELAIAGNSFDDPGQEVKIIAVPPPPTTKYGRIYRSAAFQIVIVAMLAFSGPGMSEAITALGGGGQAAPWAVNAATAVSYVMVSGSCLIEQKLKVRSLVCQPLEDPSHLD